MTAGKCWTVRTATSCLVFLMTFALIPSMPDDDDNVMKSTRAINPLGSNLNRALADDQNKHIQAFHLEAH